MILLYILDNYSYYGYILRKKKCNPLIYYSPPLQIPATVHKADPISTPIKFNPLITILINN